MTICDEMKMEAKEFFNIEDSKLYRIYNPFDIGRVKNNIESQFEIEDKNLLKDQYMIAVSRLVKEKGREDLIDI